MPTEAKPLRNGVGLRSPPDDSVWAMLSETGNADPNAVPTLANQVAVVTGGGRGVGRTIACHLSSQGARVAVASRTQKEVEETVGPD